MILKKINTNWKFWIDREAFALVWNIPKEARDITLPHDAMLEMPAHADSLNKGNTGYRDGDVYNYVKLLEVPQSYAEKSVQLMFEGIYQNAFLYVNGQLAGKNPYGYSTFTVDIKDYLNFGQENEIRIIVRNSAMTNSRWYSGGGIYRDAYLCVGNLSHIPFQGVSITIESAEEDIAVLEIDTNLKNGHTRRMNFVLETVVKDADGNIAAQDSIPVALFSGEARKMTQRLAVEKPKLWSAEYPAMYTVSSRLMQEEKILDECESPFGIRTLSLDARRGLRVNRKTVKLRGACIHHDSGLLGAATYEDAQYRQIHKLKEAGFNAVRMSHHPMAPAMLRACDNLGMYVMDETFDMWTRGKSDNDYSMFFNEYWEKDVEAMVRKDYNHPCVILYSVGNEIPEIGTDLGAKICHDICARIKAMDSKRYTLASVNGVFAAGDSVDKIVADVVADLSSNGEIDGNVNDFMTLMDGHLDEIVVHSIITKNLEKACAATDIAGYNYMTARYEQDAKAYPNRIMVGSETYPPEIARNWEIVKALDQVIGDFTWTGWDYIGEAGVGIPGYQWGEGGFGAGFPCQLAYSGDIDITGFRRPASYLREIVFGLRSDPVIAVQNPYRYGEHLIKTPWVISDSICSWTYEDCVGKPVVVEVYAPGTEAELFINGKSIGRKAAGKNVGYRVIFETTYEPGTLRAVAYDSDTVIGETELVTAGNVEKIHLEPEKPVTKECYRAEDRLIYIPVSLLDAEGNFASHQDKKLHLSVAGGANVLGFGSGNPKPEYNVNEGMTETYHGRALIILKVNGNSSSAKVTVKSEDRLTAELTLNV